MDTPYCYFKGWISRLDEHGEWRKHWFVLSDSWLRYYRDSEAEESDDMDGEIDLTSCVDVSDCDVENKYGFEIHTKRAVFTLSATTSRIRRNWVKLVKQAIQNSTHQSDTSSRKENPLSRRPSSCQPPARLTCRDAGFETTADPTKSTNTADHHQNNCTDGDLSSDLSPASQRKAGEGWDHEQAKRLEERNKWFEEGVPFGEMGSRWDLMELKKGSVPVPVIETLDSEVSMKWAELEGLSFTEMSAQSIIGAQTQQSSSAQALQPQTHLSNPEEMDQCITDSQTDLSSSYEALPSINGVQTSHSYTAGALQKETRSLRQQVESIKKERAAMGIEVDSPCGPEAPCRARLETMEAAHWKTLQDLEEEHTREIRELEIERDRVLQEESQAAGKAMEALRAAHREELERTRRSAGGTAHVDTLFIGQMPQAGVLHTELDVLSECYSQKCLELSRTEQGGKSRETELCVKEREIEQLRRENQELKDKVAEEISRMRYFITGQRSEMTSPGNAERSASEVETLLRAKETEVQYLKKEISCLQSEVQSLTKEKEAAYERYKEAYVQLSDTKNLSQLEVGSLNERLKLTNAAVQEGARGT
ncbi:myosin phosphatase Rho-interacting protein-like [Genypterus blacodes]|uniref:myosin phosphatase Rho-interacting protein-like n=1 Tax=Genypterus blacodes TaxID=154954 RepID=UPI003F76C0A9